MAQLTWKRQAALAGSLLVLSSAAYWLEYSHKPRLEEAEEKSKKLFDLKDTQVATIRVVDGPRKFAFKCLDADTKLCKPGDNSKWQMTEPTQLRADDSNV